MAVRFLPEPGERSAEAAEDRGDLAEVIELRALLKRRAWDAPGGAAGGAGSADASVDSADTRADAGGTRAAATGASAVGAPIEPVGTEPDGADIDGAEPFGTEPDGSDIDAAGAATRHGGVTGAAAAISTGFGSLSREEGEQCASEREGPSATEDGVRILARRARSSGELRDELLRLEHDPHEVEQVVAEFESSHYLDDLGLARVLTEKLRDTKRASRSQIRLKLRERRLPDAVIDEAVGELDADEEFVILRETAQDRARKLAGLDRQTAERRLLGFLARRGWSGEPAMRAAREALDGASRSGGPGGGVRFR
ncbi:regulatory protein RecX [Leucobacter sp.]